MKVGLIQTRTPATHAAALGHVLPLVRQAAAAIRIWLGQSEGWVAPGLGELYAAAEQALASRGK